MPNAAEQAGQNLFGDFWNTLSTIYEGASDALGAFSNAQQEQNIADSLGLPGDSGGAGTGAAAPPAAGAGAAGTGTSTGFKLSMPMIVGIGLIAYLLLKK